MPDGRGGPRQPQNPAAVSTPGSGRRTDGGAGSKKQPLRLPSGGAYGQRQAAQQQQQAAPLAAGGPATPGAGGPPPAGPGVGGPEGVFGPSQRPNESNTLTPGTPGMNPMAASPQAALRAIYALFPNPAIGRLIDRSSSGGLG